MTSILICAVAVLFAAGVFWIATEEYKNRKAAEKKEREVNEHAQNMAQAGETIENANSGSLDNDINYMGDVLHQLHQQAKNK